MANKRKLAVLMAGSGMACVAVFVPSVRHIVESAPKRWFSHRTVLARVLTNPRTTAPVRSEPKIALRAGALSVDAASGDMPVTADAQGSTPGTPDALSSRFGAAEPGPGEGPVTPETATEKGAPAGPSVAAKDPEGSLVRQAIDFYRRNDLASGDAAARAIQGPVARLTAEWAAIRLDSHLLGLARLDAFATAHPDWPALPWVSRRVEETVAGDRANTAQVEDRLGKAPLKTVAGKVALAQAERSRGHTDAAARIIHQVWREEELSPWQETSIGRDFAEVIDRDDHRVRAERFLYKEKVQAGLKEASLAGPDVVTLAKARVAVIGNSSLADIALGAVPKPLQADPLMLFSRIQRLRRANKAVEAAELLASAPRDPALMIDGDEWWTERRIVARKLLDLGDPQRAYRICAEHGVASRTSDIEAEFHAGWIALRFLNDPKTAAGHFAAIAKLAETPISKARAAYWQGRAAETQGAGDEATRHYIDAAAYSITFYGQLAASRLGRTSIALRTVPAATAETRSEAVRVTEYLYGLGARDIALPLAIDIGRAETSEAQIGAVGDVLERNRDAWASLTVGKAATQRGMALDDTAFPTFGIPNFRPLPNSADLTVVYAIARQESEFDPRSSSSAGAKGLMQMISSTARSTAARAGVSYDDGRLASDPAFNAQLGAAHLGTLLDEEGGSYILAFAAYNAGGKAVHDWVAAYGDPRKPGIDVVDWIERIPYSETRNYVQRVMENLQIYRAKLGRPAVMVVGTEPPSPAGKGT
jgi:soluble lytic murein transglycosylase